jgi:sec-independent protein translocase protein TatA
MPLGPWELAVILIIVLVIFGAGKLSQVGSALGKSIREFKVASSDETLVEEREAQTRSNASVITQDETVR